MFKLIFEMETVDVNRFYSIVDSGKSSLEAIKSGSVYKEDGWLNLKHKNCIKKIESNIKINVNPASPLVKVTEIPLITRADIKRTKDMRDYNFIHMGCIIVGIQGLFRKNAGVKGVAMLIDKRWDNLRQAMIGSFAFNLDSCRADAIFKPCFSLSVGDQLLTESLTLLLKFDGLAMRSGSMAVNVSFGLICKLMNTLDSNVEESSEIVDVPMRGAEKIQDSNILVEMMREMDDRFSGNSVIRPIVTDERYFNRGLFKERGVQRTLSSRAEASQNHGSARWLETFLNDKVKIDGAIMSDQDFEVHEKKEFDESKQEGQHIEIRSRKRQDEPTSRLQSQMQGSGGKSHFEAVAEYPIQ
ncbi:movement protein [Lettuce chordovirus 1]|uniref:Movement protein n=1 Tax=Lettuce chordovirus 1 TaxID=2200955 RepID=A0A2S1ZRC8_9VIRU|nr:movement protein [Lettuce chordovirus 1]AWK28018.1 movement protein [Lettuce chordovirus 1]